MEISLIITTLVVLIFQFFLDFILKSEKKKKYIGIFVLCLGLFSVITTYFLQEADKREADLVHEKEINDQKERFNKLDIELKLRNKDLKDIKQQNDSLKAQIFKLNEKQDKFIKISKISAQEISRSRIAIENLGYRQISRGISQIDKIQMVEILKKFKGSKIDIVTINGDIEATQFSYQIKEVFELAEWDTGNGVNQAFFQGPVNGIKIQVKSGKKYPVRVNSIYDAFKVLNFIAKGEENSSLGEDYVKLIIGAK